MVMRTSPRVRNSALAALLLMLAGCGSQPAPVADRSSWDVRGRTVHVVQRGETLYSIAWRYGLDWQRLARRNGIDAPYTIHPGERLRLRGIGADAERRAARQGASGSATGRSGGAGGAGTRASEAGDQASGGSQGDASDDAPEASVAGGTSGAAGRTPSGQTRERAEGPRWAWPVAGEVVRGFSTDGDVLNKGLDIRGESGASLTTAAAGEVVYAGSGLRGYGALVIVKHDGDWLSAYAHNHPILVREGQRLQQGDAIAEISGDGDRARTVHFEIRHRGDPVDPAELLPPP